MSILSMPKIRGVPSGLRKLPLMTTDKLKIIGVIVARLDSSRLPGKVLKEVCGKPLIKYVLERARRIELLEDMVLATTNRPLDDPLANLFSAEGVKVFRGDVDDVAHRVLACALFHQADYFIRLNGDSPFLDYELINRGIKICLEKRVDFISNIVSRTYPYGIAVEIINTKVFERIYQNMTLTEKEHVTQYLYKNIDLIDHIAIQDENPKYNVTRLVVDTEEDLKLCEKLVTILGDDVLDANYREVSEVYCSIIP